MDSGVSSCNMLAIPAKITTVDTQVLPVNSESKTKDKYLWIAGQIHRSMDIVKIEDLGEYYYKNEQSKLYTRLSDDRLCEMVTQLWYDTFGAFMPKEIRDTVDVIKYTTSHKIDKINSNSIMVCDKLYWNKKTGDLSDEASEALFYRLFDTDYPDRHTVSVSEFTTEQRQRLLDRYARTKTELSRGTFNCPYEFINVWANNDHDIAIDILKLIAACFLDKKPLGSGILVGLRRNGKSTFIDMLHTLFGNKNTSRVQLTQLGDYHHNHALRYTLMNAPDEEEEKAVEYSGMFKTMADHGVLDLPVMRSNQSLRVPCDFMSFFPMNHIPEWKGTGASACVARSLIVPFDNDLSKYDKSSKNFCEETFTADMFCELLGTVFAYAWYYHRHELVFSSRMKDEQEMLQEDTESAIVYRKELERYFDGFDCLNTAYNDYRYWCASRGITPSTKDRFKFVFRPYNRTKYYQKDGLTNIYREKKERGIMRGDPLMIDTFRMGIGIVKNLHDKSVSMVERMENKYGEVLGKEERKQYELGQTDTSK